MPISSEEKYLGTLIRRINKGECTPFLGAGACHGMLPLAKDIAEDWAKEYEYPMKNSSDLPRVAEFLAVDLEDAMLPKDLIVEQFEKFETSEAKEAEESREALRSLARLPLPLYITTNYDYSMEEALKKEKKNVRTEYLRWNDFLKKSLEPSILDSDFVLTKDNPVVFHFHGHINVKQSLVLTEGDYLDFLKNITKCPDLIPTAIQTALATTSVLFLGYRLTDLNFLVVFHGILSSLGFSAKQQHISVQLVPEDEIVKPYIKAEKDRVEKYLDSYFKRYKIRISWVKCCDFIKKLMEQGGFD